MLKNTALALLAVFLGALPWWIPASSPLLFVAFTPLLFLESRLGSSPLLRDPWIPFAILFALSWSGLVALAQDFPLGHWLLYAGGSTLALLLFRLIKKHLGAQRGYIGLLFLWAAMESLSFYIDWPARPAPLGGILREGSSFQLWSPFTGVLGLSLWAMLFNILLFRTLHSYSRHREWKPLTGQSVLLFGILFLFPLLWQPTPTSVNGGDEKIESRYEEVLTVKPGATLEDRRDPRLISTRPQAVLSKADRFLSRLSFFISIFLVLFAVVRGWLDHAQKPY